MDLQLQQLSQNWNKLKAKLKEQKPTLGKRKLDTSPEDVPPTSPKRRKTLTPSTKKPAPTTPTKTSASLALWAEQNDIPLKDVATAYATSTKSEPPKFQDRPNEGLAPNADLGTYVALDCEMIGIKKGEKREKSILARVSVVNFHGDQIYDSYVKPAAGEVVTNWRTWVSGIEKKHMAIARERTDVLEDIRTLIAGRIVIGHSIRGDMKILGLKHPPNMIRDTQKLAQFQQFVGNKSPGLKRLCLEFLGLEIQNGSHSSIEDARASILLFKKFKTQFEVEHSKRLQKKPSESTEPPKPPAQESLTKEEQEEAERRKNKSRKKNEKSRERKLRRRKTVAEQNLEGS